MARILLGVRVKSYSESFLMSKRAKIMKNALICTASPHEGECLKFMLSGLGFANIMETFDNDRALTMASDVLPEIAIIDTAAKGTGWLKTVASIREKLRIPVILLGKGFGAESIKQALAAGAGGFLTKPLRKEELWPAIELAAVHNHEVEGLKDKVAELEGALESRKTIEKAKGVLMRENGLSEPEAFRRMQKLAMDKRTSLKKIAEAILLTGGNGLSYK
jgi:response regulator NasT